MDYSGIEREAFSGTSEYHKFKQNLLWVFWFGFYYADGSTVKIENKKGGL